MELRPAPLGDTRSAPCRDTVPAVLAVPAPAPCQQQRSQPSTSLFPSREDCLEPIHRYYSCFSSVNFGTLCLASRVVLSLFCSWLDASGSFQSCSASLEGWLNERERESRHSNFVSKQVCCLKFHSSSEPIF